MKATLHFNLEEERDQFEISIQAIDFHTAIWQFNEWLIRKSNETHGELKAVYKDCIRELDSRMDEMSVAL